MATLEDILTQERARLFGLAYRMLGSAAEAEDVLQEAFLRARETSLETIRSPASLLTTIVVRLCIDQKRSARARREVYVGPWLPEPVPTRSDADPIERAEQISQAFLVVLESLSPLGRAAYLLREVLGYEYPEIASVLDRDERACRQLVSRAKREILERRPRFAPSREEHRILVERFAETVRTGDVHGLAVLLSEQVAAIADGGGMIGVARSPVLGREKVARYFVRLAGALGMRFEPAELNGWVGLLGVVGGQVFCATQFETDGAHVLRISTTVNPEKLHALRSGQVLRLEATEGPSSGDA
ncbi:MAG: RNA polymerase sigma factor SigJ [Polyangiaceae bacterium]